MTSRFWGSRVLRVLNTKIAKIRNAAAHVRVTQKHLLNVLRGAVLVCIGVALFVLMSGVRIPLDLLRPSKTLALETKIVSTPAKDAQVCTEPLADNGAFAPCPSFWVDFSQEKDGRLNEKQFNILTDHATTNREAQLYTADLKNVRIENGNLVIQARDEPKKGYQYTSARVETHGKADFLYGKIVVRAKLPKGVGTWPAIWLLPSDSKYAKMGTAAEQARGLNDGEIDIVEAIGSYPHLVYGITHTALYHQDGRDRTFFNTVKVRDNYTAFHDYGMEWTPTSITVSVDGVPFHRYTKRPNATYKQWPFDQPYYLVMNLALGGSWAGRDKRVGPDGIDRNALPATLQIQSVDYYPYIGPM